MRTMLVKISEVTPEALAKLTAFIASEENRCESTETDPQVHVSPGLERMIKWPIVELKHLKERRKFAHPTQSPKVLFSLTISVIVSRFFESDNLEDYGSKIKSETLQKIWNMLGIFPSEEGQKNVLENPDINEAVGNLEVSMITAALKQAEGDKDRAADLLRISRFALQRKLEKYALDSGPRHGPRSQ